jgi:hypothetical protein
MKFLVGTIAYLSVVSALIVATVAGVSSVDRRQPEAAPILASSSNEERAVRTTENAEVDPDRVPVWIVPTAKYVYTPVPIDQQKPRRTAVIGAEARGAMARDLTRDPRSDGRRAIERALGETRRESGRALGFARSRDNDPFHRD